MVASLPGRGVPAKPGWVGVNTCAGTASASWSAHPVTVWGPPPPCMTRMGWPSPRSDTVTSISPIPSTDRVWVLVSMITPCALELANTDGEQRRDGLLDAPGKQQSSEARGQDDPRTDPGLQAPGEQAGRGVAGEHAAQSFGDAQVRDVLVREDQALYEHHADDGEQHPHGRESGSGEVTRGEQLRAEQRCGRAGFGHEERGERDSSDR